MQRHTLTKRLLALTLLACAATLWGGCDKPATERHKFAFDALGTKARLMVLAPDEASATIMFDAARKQIDGVGRTMSTFHTDSPVSRLNADGAAELTPDTLVVIARARVFWQKSDGAFDITYAPLRDLWRKAVKDARVPSDEELTAALARVGMDKLIVEGKRARFTTPKMQIDLGAIAKGYAIDLATRALQDAGATAGIVDIGGDVRLFGTPPDKPKWQVQVRSFADGPQEPIFLALTDCAVATSGDYERGYRVGEQWFSHIIDATTGLPVADTPSVTVVAPDAATADALATVMSVLPVAKSIALADSMPGVECLLMHRAESGEVKLHMSKGFGELIASD